MSGGTIFFATFLEPIVCTKSFFVAQLKTEFTFYLVIESTAYLMIKFAAVETTSPLAGVDAREGRSICVGGGVDPSLWVGPRAQRMPTLLLGWFL